MPNPNNTYTYYCQDAVGDGSGGVTVRESDSSNRRQHFNSAEEARIAILSRHFPMAKDGQNVLAHDDVPWTELGEVVDEEGNVESRWYLLRIERQPGVSKRNSMSDTALTLARLEQLEHDLSIWLSMSRAVCDIGIRNGSFSALLQRIDDCRKLLKTGDLK